MSSNAVIRTRIDEYIKKEAVVALSNHEAYGFRYISFVD